MDRSKHVNKKNEQNKRRNHKMVQCSRNNRRTDRRNNK